MVFSLFPLPGCLQAVSLNCSSTRSSTRLPTSPPFQKDYNSRRRPTRAPGQPFLPPRSDLLANDRLRVGTPAICSKERESEKSRIAALVEKNALVFLLDVDKES